MSRVPEKRQRMLKVLLEIGRPIQNGTKKQPLA